MPQSNGLAATPAIDCSAPRHEITRRLSDKILTAFNHAYAIGEIEVAEKLREVLAFNAKPDRVEVEQRVNFDPLGRAELWVDFVEARNRYNEMCSLPQPASAGADKALEAMKEAYRRWSTG